MDELVIELGASAFTDIMYFPKNMIMTKCILVKIIRIKRSILQ